MDNITQIDSSFIINNENFENTIQDIVRGTLTINPGEKRSVANLFYAFFKNYEKTASIELISRIHGLAEFFINKRIFPNDFVINNAHVFELHLLIEKSKTAPRPAYFSDIPQEILQNIFSNLRLSELGKIKSLSSGCYNFFRDKGFEQQILMTRPPRSAIRAINTASKLGNIRRLDLSNCHDIAKLNDEHIKLLVETCPDLLELVICNNDVTNEANITDATLEHISRLPYLQKLVLHNYPGFTPEGLKSLGKNTFLSELDLTNCRLGNDHILSLSQGPIYLKELILSTNLFDDSALRALSKLHHLEHLNMSITNITGEGLQHLNNKPIRHLDISSCDSLCNAGLQHLPAIETLKHLNIQCCKKISDITPLRSLTILETLLLNNSRKVSQESLALILERCRKLSHISLRQLHISDRILQALKNLSSLNYVDLSWAIGLNFSEIKQLREACPRLEVETDLSSHPTPGAPRRQLKMLMPPHKKGHPMSTVDSPPLSPIDNQCDFPPDFMLENRLPDSYDEYDYIDDDRKEDNTLYHHLQRKRRLDPTPSSKSSPAFSPHSSLMEEDDYSEDDRFAELRSEEYEQKSPRTSPVEPIWKDDEEYDKELSELMDQSKNFSNNTYPPFPLSESDVETDDNDDEEILESNDISPEEKFNYPVTPPPPPSFRRKMPRLGPTPPSSSTSPSYEAASPTAPEDKPLSPHSLTDEELLDLMRPNSTDLPEEPKTPVQDINTMRRLSHLGMNIPYYPSYDDESPPEEIDQDDPEPQINAYQKFEPYSPSPLELNRIETPNVPIEGNDDDEIIPETNDEKDIEERKSPIEEDYDDDEIIPETPPSKYYHRRDSDPSSTDLLNEL